VALALVLLVLLVAVVVQEQLEVPVRVLLLVMEELEPQVHFLVRLLLMQGVVEEVHQHRVVVEQVAVEMVHQLQELQEQQILEVEQVVPAVKMVFLVALALSSSPTLALRIKYFLFMVREL
jgi:hypothetical protein